MKLLKIVYDAVGILAATVVTLFIIFDFVVNDKEPTNFTTYISLLLYMQMFLKHR